MSPPKTIEFRGKEYKLDKRWGPVTKDRALALTDYLRHTNYVNATAKEFDGKYYIYTCGQAAKILESQKALEKKFDDDWPKLTGWPTGKKR